MSNPVPFQQVDVFTSKPYKGNPVAVVMNGDALNEQQMQQIANWTHLSETTFICRPTEPEADYRLRIFTPQNELPFAGHPTIGSAWAALQSGITPKYDGYLVQECGEGLVNIAIKGDELFLTLPAATKQAISTEMLTAITNGLGTSVDNVELYETIDVGAIWITIQLKNREQVLALNPDFTALGQAIPKGITGVTVLGKRNDSDADLEVRSFAPNEGANEDPVCGSGNGCVAIMVKEHHLLEKEQYVATQGQALGRDGHVTVKFNKNGDILVGGKAVTCITGDIIAE
ncbi:PhzF family phenazine biosynthesis protein [Lactobacillaceae bacterium Melli_B3]